MISITTEYRQYDWIANKFAKINGVVNVTLDHTEDGMNLFIDNGLDGDDKKSFEFPLRRLFFADYGQAKDVKNEYDIMELEDPKSMVELGHAKAHMFFNNIKLDLPPGNGRD